MTSSVITAANTFTVNSTEALTVTAKLGKQSASFPNHEQDRNRHNQYKVTVKSSNGGRVHFDFYDSAANLAKGIVELDSAALSEALACFIGDATTALNCRSTEELAEEFGFSIDSRKEYQRVARIYKACEKASAKFEKLGLDSDAQFDLANLLSE